jgi:hypothetical protein
MKIERMEDCKLVKTKHEENGHDCWGNYEYYTIRYVKFRGLEKNVYSGDYIIHNDNIIFGILGGDDIRKISDMEERYKNTGFYTEEEVKAYMRALKATNYNSGV